MSRPVQDTGETAAKAVLKQAQSQLSHGHSLAALNTLHTFLTTKSRTSMIWNKYHEDIFQQHVNLAVKLRRDQYLRMALHGYRLRVAQLDKAVMIDAIEYLREKLLDLIETAVAEHAEYEPTEMEKTIWAATGIGAMERASARILDTSIVFFNDVIKHILNTIGYLGKFEVLYQDTIRETLATFLKLGRKNEFCYFTETLRRHAENSFKSEEQLNSILNSSEVIQSIVETKHFQLQGAAKLHQWEVVYACLNDMKNIITILRRNGKPIKFASLLPFYESLTGIFLNTKNMHFHAHVSVVVARMTVGSGSCDEAQARQLASRATLAVLCVPEVSVPMEVTVQQDTERERMGVLTKAFSLTSTPSRVSLTSDILRPTALGGRTLLDLADPVVRQLYQLLSNVTSVSVCQQVAPLLPQLPAAFEPYQSLLQDIAIRSMVSVMSLCFSQVPTTHLMRLVAFFEESEHEVAFNERVEPLLMNATMDSADAINVAVDFAADNVLFSQRKDAGDVAVGSQGAFAASLSNAVHACFAAPMEPAKPQPLDVLKAIEEERKLIVSRTYLGGLRNDREKERKELAKKREQEARERELQRRVAEEEGRRKQRQQEEITKVAKQVAEQEAIERRKWTLKMINAKNKGLDLPETMARLSKERFEEEIHQKMVAHRKLADVTRESDHRLINHFERAVREVEIPRRIKHDAETAAQNKAAHEARQKNVLEQHRKDWENARALKERLGRFLDHKDRYEAEIQRAYKKLLQPSHRKSDEDDLLKMKKDLEAAANE